jgi:hypothetical protein
VILVAGPFGYYAGDAAKITARAGGRTAPLPTGDNGVGLG